MTPKELIDAVLDEKGTVKQVYWVACGGSMIDMIPASYLVNAQSSYVQSLLEIINAQISLEQLLNKR